MNLRKISILSAVGALALASLASAAGTMTYSASGLPAPLPNAGTSGPFGPKTITVPNDAVCGGSDVVLDVDIHIQYTHTWNSDLQFWLATPAGTEIQLWSGVGGSSDNMNVRIDDEGASNMSAQVLDGSARRPQQYPSAAMCKFDLESAVGNWVFRGNDQFGGDSGQMQVADLTITCGPAPSGGGGNDSGPHRPGDYPNKPPRPYNGGSEANNGYGNGGQLSPPGQHGDHKWAPEPDLGGGGGLPPNCQNADAG